MSTFSSYFLLRCTSFSLEFTNTSPFFATSPTTYFPEHGPSLVGGGVTVNDASLVIHFQLYSFAAMSRFECVAFFGTSSSQPFIFVSVWDSINPPRRHCSLWACHCPSFWGDFGTSAPLNMTTPIRRSATFTVCPATVLRQPLSCGPLWYLILLCYTRFFSGVAAGCFLTAFLTAPLQHDDRVTVPSESSICPTTTSPAPPPLLLPPLRPTLPSTFDKVALPASPCHQLHSLLASTSSTALTLTGRFFDDNTPSTPVIFTARIIRCSRSPM